MKYYQVNFSIHPYSEAASDVLSALLADIGFETFVPSENGVVAYIQQKTYNEQDISAITSTFVLPLYTITYQTEAVQEEDWNQTWETEGFTPIILDSLICIHAPQHTNVPSCQYDIIINPRMAFGTGTHPTTQQILRQLTAMELQGLRVIDAGCGTGVLGFLASMRGAKEIFSFDIDNWSVENTRLNAELNHITNLEVEEGDASILKHKHDYDLLIANINRNILLNDIPRYAAALNNNAQLLLSGFQENDIPMLLNKCKEYNFNLKQQTSIDGWSMLLLGASHS